MYIESLFVCINAHSTERGREKKRKTSTGWTYECKDANFILVNTEM